MTNIVREADLLRAAGDTYRQAVEEVALDQRLPAYERLGIIATAQSFNWSDTLAYMHTAVGDELGRESPDIVMADTEAGWVVGQLDLESPWAIRVADHRDSTWEMRRRVGTGLVLAANFRAARIIRSMHTPFHADEPKVAPVVLPTEKHSLTLALGAEPAGSENFGRRLSAVRQAIYIGSDAAHEHIDTWHVGGFKEKEQRIALHAAVTRAAVQVAIEVAT
jgi:hypothetical protein